MNTMQAMKSTHSPEIIEEKEQLWYRVPKDLHKEI